MWFMRREVVDVVEIDVGGDDVGELQARFLEAVEQASHRLPDLGLDGRDENVL